MAGDYTRLTFDPRRDRAMVLEQQGRVHLDADWNELVAILERRLRVETYDFAGPAVVPAAEPESFRIVYSGGQLGIVRGRIYVDGLLAENHGYGQTDYEPVWGESVGSLVTRIDKQPYLGSAEDAKKLLEELKRGRSLVYLDVWQREQTAVEDSSMLEPALGVDTCTRVQTVWQVRFLELDDQNLTCDSDWSTYPPWVALTAPSAGRLTSWADKAVAPADPCAVAPVAGYRGTENRLYRVEVHDGGGAGEATVKWSRDNGAVATPIVGPVTDTTSKPVVPVQRIGRDDVLRFAPTDWVELLDDSYELDGVPGLIAQVDSVEISNSTITLTAPLGGTIDLTRNPRVRRWDQTKALTNGVIPITAFPQTIELEDGVNVKLELADPAGTLHTGDWWVFAARAATATVEELDAQPPRGIRHHFARLAIVQTGKIVADCRVVFPGECECESDCGCTVCVTPKSHAGGDGPLTIQDAIDRVTATGGRVCLAEGAYTLQKPLEIDAARGLTLSGEGARTVISYVGDGLGIAVRDSLDVALEQFTLAVARQDAPTSETTGPKTQVLDEALMTNVPPRATAPLGGQTVAIALVNTVDCRVEGCFVVSGFAPGAAGSGESINGSLGIGLGGWALRTRITDNVVFGDVAVGDLTLGRAGISNAVSYTHLNLDAGYVASIDLAIRDNLLLGLAAGVDLGSIPARPTGTVSAREQDAALGPALHLGVTRIADNLVLGPRAVGIAVLGTTAGAPTPQQPISESAATHVQTESAAATHTAASAATLLAEVLVRGLDRLEVSGNVIDASGIGIAVSPGNVRIEGNDVSGAAAGSGTGRGGVLLVLGSSADGQTRIVGNTIRNEASFGIAWNGAPGSVEVRENRLSRIGGYGIAGALGARVELADIRDNLIETVFASSAAVAYGIQVGGAAVAEVRGNTVAGVGVEEAKASRAGILASGCRITQITDNILLQIGPAGEHTGLVYGIAYGGLLQTLDVRGNVVELGQANDAAADVAVFVFGGGNKLETFADTESGTSDQLRLLVRTVQRDNPSVLTPVFERAEQVATPRIFVGNREVDPVPPRAGDVAIVDNVVRTASAVPLVMIETNANVTFAQNRVARTGSIAGTAAVVATTPGATIVTSNRVEAPPSELPAIVLAVDSSSSLPPHCTVLGNITTRPILLNGAPLAGQWADLNIVA
jgi:hypothetical protein